jgi:hypothetical protein
LAEFPLPSDTDTLIQFFEFHGIEDIDDFMSFDATDLKQKYSDLSNAPDTLLAVSTVIIKKFLLFNPGQDYDSDPFPIYFSLTHIILTILWRTQTIQRFENHPKSSSVD